MNKLGKMDTLLLIVIIAAGYLFISSGGLAKLTGGGTTVINQGGTIPTTPINLPDCIGVEDTTVTFTIAEKYNIGTQPTEAIYYYLNDNVANHGGDTQGTSGDGWISNGASITISPGDKVTYVAAFNDTAISANDPGLYVSQKFEETIPCTGTHTLNGQVYELTNITARVYNEEGVVITDDVTNNETLVAGDVVDLKLELLGQYEKGEPHGFLAVIEYNKTYFDKIELNGFGATKAAVPVFYSISGTDRETEAFDIEAFDSSTIKVGTLHIDAADATDPTGPVVSSNITICFYPKGYWLNNQGEIKGPNAEDEDDNSRVEIPNDARRYCASIGYD